MNPQLENILMREAIIVQQELEISNVIVGIDMGNRYSIHVVLLVFIFDNFSTMPEHAQYKFSIHNARR